VIERNRVLRASSLPIFGARATLLLLLLLAICRPAAAQRGSVAEIVGKDLEYFAGDILSIWTSPLRARSSDIYPFIGLTQAVVLTGVVDGEIVDWLRAHPNSVPVRALAPFREPAPINLFGRALVLQPLSVALYVAGHIAQNEDLRAAGIGCSASSLSNMGARYAIGRFAGRLRPRYNMGPYDFDLFRGREWERRSFPNGHGANIMACVSYWNHRFDLGAAEPLLYAFAIAVGSARVTADAHWTSDTIFGLVFGYAVGRGVAARFENRDIEELQQLQSNRVARRLSIGWRIPLQ
jgi:membrane-associated phospholipid phosphatase